MESTISIHMSVKELEDILFNQHGIYKAHGWQIVLWMIFNTYKATEARVVGYGLQARLVFPDGSVAFE